MIYHKRGNISLAHWHIMSSQKPDIQSHPKHSHLNAHCRQSFLTKLQKAFKTAMQPTLCRMPLQSRS